MTIPNPGPALAPRSPPKPASVLGPPWLAAAAVFADAWFEADATGHFIGFGSELVFGHSAESLRGAPISCMFDIDPGLFEAILAELFSAPAGAPATWHGKFTVKHANTSLTTIRLSLVAGAGSFHGIVIDLDAKLPDFSNFPLIPAASPIARLLCPETGLWLLSSFIDQAARRFDRLDIEDRPGTMILLGFSGAEADLITPIAITIAEELQDIIRPTDLLARIAPATIALWCDGMDHLTGGERASRLCKYIPTAIPGQSLISIGLVTRWPGSADDPENLLVRANLALAKAEIATAREATGQWHVWLKDHAA